MATMTTKRPFRLGREEAIVRSYFPLEPMLKDYKSHDFCAFSPDGRKILVISEHKAIHLFQAEECKKVATIPNEKYLCDRAAFHADSSNVYLNSHNQTDHSARLLSLDKAKFVRYYRTYQGHINSIFATSIGIITSSDDNTIKMFDDRREEPTSLLQFASPPVIALHPNGIGVSVFVESQLHFYDVRNLNSGPVSTSADSDLIHPPARPYFGCRGTQLAIIDNSGLTTFTTDRFQQALVVPYDACHNGNGFAFNPSEDYAIYPKDDFSLSVADMKTGENVTVLAGHKARVDCIAFSPDTFNFMSVGQECIFWVNDMQTLANLEG